MSKALYALLAVLCASSLFAATKPAPPPDLNTPPADAEGEGGLVSKKLAEGTGTEKPAADNIVRIRFTVWKSDGSVIQSTPGRSSALLGVDKMIPGWSTTVQKMVVGEKRRIWIPAAFAGGKVKPDESLTIDTELVEIIEAPKTPEDVAAPPADAKKTPSGLAYKVLREGTGTKKPNRYATVVVHYSGWTTDGARFDSSILRGYPAEFSLDQVIRGWTEGLQLMVKGEKTRFWIPSNLAYGNDRSKPQGMLVFDVELIDIK